MTLSETQIDKFCQSPLRLHLPSNHPSEATTPILGTLNFVFLASVSTLYFTAETPSAPRKISEKRQIQALVGSDRRIFISRCHDGRAAGSRPCFSSLLLGELGVSAVK